MKISSIKTKVIKVPSYNECFIIAIVILVFNSWFYKKGNS